MLNTKMIWAQMATELTAKSTDHYVHTGESMYEAVLRTCLLGETEETVGKVLPYYEYDQLELNAWRLLTLGKECLSRLMGYVIVCVAIRGMRVARPLTRW